MTDTPLTPETTPAPAVAGTTVTTAGTGFDFGGLLNLVPGFQTSEMWVVIATTVGGVLAKVGLFCSGPACSAGAFTDADFGMLVGAGLFYAAQRFLLKNKTLTLRAALQQALNSQ